MIVSIELSESVHLVVEGRYTPFRLGRWTAPENSTEDQPEEFEAESCEVVFGEGETEIRVECPVSVANLFYNDILKDAIEQYEEARHGI